MKIIVKILKILFSVIIFTALILVFFLFAKPLWNHFVTYPKLEKEHAKIQTLQKPVNWSYGKKIFRGIIHAHSYWSHDSEGTLAEILPAAGFAGIDFIFLTDHPHEGLDTLPRGYSGMYGNVRIVPGSEKKGFICWPRDSMLIDWSQNGDTILKNIVSKGGLALYSHTEEPHNWENPDYQGMEIYNFHTDTKDEKNLYGHILNFVVNGKKYRNWALREMFDEQVEILKNWDMLNTKRRITGFSAMDTHENQNIRARYLPDGRVEWVGPNANIMDTMQVKWWNKWLFSTPDESGWIFKFMVDTYRDGFNYMVNYVVADSSDVENLSGAIKKGRLFTAFKSIADASDFVYYAVDQKDSLAGIMGDSIKLNNLSALKANSPFPGKFKLFHNGKLIANPSDDSYSFTSGPLKEEGAYRLEVHLKFNGKYIPWLYTNPVYVY